VGEQIEFGGPAEAASTQPPSLHITAELAWDQSWYYRINWDRLMTIKLDRETHRLIEGEIQAGRFHDASAFVTAAIRHFVITREDLGHTREQVDAMIAQAIESLDRGEGVDGEDFFAELEREERELERRQG
jgi:Arc/MetJ-type ribon-helix-helix transcriptional regulator